jgi:hypothetical protein
MNKFEISIKQDGEYQPIQATPVFPFSWGELLDERLDEAYITLYDSPEKTYKRLTDVKVTITNGSRVKEEYFIIASDNSYELPVGSGKYKHDIYLIERTKLLEGIYCSTITFTNQLGNVYTDTKYSPIATDSDETGFNTLNEVVGGIFATSVVKAPYAMGEQYTAPTAKDVGEALSQAIADFNPSFSNVHTVASALNQATNQLVYTGVTVDAEGSEASALWDNTATITPYADIKLEYTIAIEFTSVSMDTFTLFCKFYFLIATVENRLPLKRWTITNCITRACELAEPLFAGETPKYRLDGVEYDGNGKVVKPYTAGSLAERYDKVFAPEFTATEDTLREQLKLILSYVHAEPWLDENDVIKVTEYGGTTKSAAANLPYVYSAVSSHINEYCTEVRSHAQNLVSSLGYARGVITDPGNGLYRSLRSETAYVRINENNGIATTTFPIYTIEKVMCGIAETDGTGWLLAPAEITPYVFEETEYSANLSSYSGGYPLSKQYAIYYTQGAPNLKGLFFKPPNAINSASFSPFAISNILAAATGQEAAYVDDLLTGNFWDDILGKPKYVASLVFSISYKPISNHFVSHGKQLYVSGETPYMQLYNQSENLVESQYYGENLRGVAARLGNIEKERTFILKNINDVPRVGEILDGYAISAVSCELYPFDIKCTVGLTKDFNRISEYVGINSQKRMYEISERAAVDRAILIKETLVIGKRPAGYNANAYIWRNLNPFYTVFDSDANYNDKISAAIFLARNSKGELKPPYVCLPVISRALGNVITLNFAMKDNYSAGNKTEFITSDNNDLEGRWEQDVRYSNYYGRVWFSEIWFLHSDIARQLNATNAQLSDLAYKLPDITGTVLTDLSSGAVMVHNHLLRKDNRERISYNVELDIKTSSEDIIVSTALADLCGWVNDTAVAPVIYYFDASKYTVGKFDKLYTPHNDDTYGGTFAGVAPDAGAWKVARNGDGSLTLTVNPRGTGCGWVICTPITTRDEQVDTTSFSYGFVIAR